MAEAGFGVVCGGLGGGGVMEGTCEGAASVHAQRTGGTLGILPGTSPGDANRWVDVVVPTGTGYARNVTVVLTAAAVVAVGGESGTLSEIAHAWQLGRPVAAYLPAGGWGERLAGERIDQKRGGRIEPIVGPAGLIAWLASLG